jgi:hypothetical protein
MATIGMSRLQILLFAAAFSVIALPHAAAQTGAGWDFLLAWV